MRGFRLYKRKVYKRAAPAFELAHAMDGRYALPVYNRACVAGLLGDVAGAVAWLERLTRMNTTQARKVLKLSRKDRDFVRVRGAAAFKAFMARNR